ncbi:MAG TPA: hypothetical protein VMW48_08650, partial [Vicinamibacterales bacterium]|nr:hypothetical protein [Vicinamibacterales bacterium]
MTAATLLRAAVWAIALAGLIDPRVVAWRRPPLDADLALPLEADADAVTPPRGGAGAARAQLVRELTAAVGGAVRLRVRPFAAGERLPCAADRPCVVVTSDEVAPRGGLARRQPLLTIAPPPPEASGTVTLDDVEVSPVMMDERATAAVTISASGAAGRQTQLEIRDGPVPVGALRHAWTSASPVTLDVPWWPVRAGLRRLTVTATTPAGGDRPAQQNRGEVSVEVAAGAWPVLVIEARPSWAVTFVRRALEADPRLDVDAVTALAPGLAVARDRPSVDDARISRARVIVVGGLDAVTARDVTRYERFLAQRGGALVFVPDAAPAGPITTLLPGRWQRRLEAGAMPAVFGTAAGTTAPGDTLRASEWLLASALAPGDAVLAEHDGAPAIVSRAVGEGRVVVVGALDAWRFRGAAPPGGETRDVTGAGPAAAATPFARVWQGLVAELARGSGAPVDVRIGYESGDDEATVDVQARALEARQSWSAAARVVCGDSDVPLRLWPQARAGHFRGRTPLPKDEVACEVMAAVAGLGEGRASLTAPPATPGEGRRVAHRLHAIAARSGGVAAAPGDIGALAAALVALSPAEPAPTPMRPMRSWWW